MSFQEHEPYLKIESNRVSVKDLLEQAGFLGCGDVMEAICSNISNTGQALRGIGVDGYILAGSITRTKETTHSAQANDFFTNRIRAIQPLEIKLSNMQKTKGDAKPFDQLWDFLTGQNADLLIDIPAGQSIESVYETLCENLPKDMESGEYIISLAQHAGRFTLIQISSTSDPYHQGINIIPSIKGDVWNITTSGRLHEIATVKKTKNGSPYIIPSNSGEPSALLIQPTTIEETLAIFSQELRRCTLDHTRSMFIAKYINLLKVLPSKPNHEQYCLIAANLMRAFVEDPIWIDQLIKTYSLEKYFHERPSGNINRIIGDTNDHILFAKLIAYCLPITIEEFLALPPTTHPVIHSARIRPSSKLEQSILT